MGLSIQQLISKNTNVFVNINFKSFEQTFLEKFIFYTIFIAIIYKIFDFFNNSMHF